MMILSFADQNVPYATFLEDLTTVLVAKLRDVECGTCDVISQRKAYRLFGEGNVRRWVRQMQLEAVSRSPGKIEYRITDLRLLQQGKKGCVI
jgi:hypothetical protein